MDFFKFLGSFSQVETVISLLAFIIAGFFGFLIYQNATKMKQISSIIDKANTQTKADLATSLAGVLPTYTIPKLSKEHGFEIVKLQLEQRSNEFKSRITLLRLGMLLLFVVIITLVGKNYIDSTTTYGNQSPSIEGDNANIEFNNTTSQSNDSIK